MSKKRITLSLTPLQLAAVIEAAQDYENFMVMPSRQARATARAAEIMEKARNDAGEPWPL